MAFSMSETVEINRPAGEVFAYLSDLNNDPKWQKTIVEAKYTSEGPVAVGTTGVHRGKGLGKTFDFGWEMTEYEEPRRAGWKFISGPFSGTDGYTLESTPGGTKLTHAAELQPHGLFRLLTPILGGGFARQARNDLQTLKRILESQ